MDDNFLRKIVSPQVEVAESFNPLANNNVLIHEDFLVEKSSEKRKQEFVTSRILAHRALSKLGFEKSTILKGSKGEPIWPKDVIGSITHTDGFYAAAVAHKMLLRSIGIDAENNSVLKKIMLDSICNEKEKNEINTFQKTFPDINWGKLLFSAKESLYKCWYPITKRWLGFLDAEIHFEINSIKKMHLNSISAFSGNINAKILINSQLPSGELITNYYGKWIQNPDYVGTVIELSW